MVIPSFTALLCSSSLDFRCNRCPIDDIFSKEMYFGAALLGLGEIFANISAISLIGSAAPAKGRGAVIGGFSFFGAIGILLVASIGGYLFDNVGPTAPFTMVGFANLALLILALLLLFLERRKKIQI